MTIEEYAGSFIMEKKLLTSILINIILLATTGIWVLSQATPSSEATRLRNALLAQVGNEGDFSWKPGKAPLSYQQEKLQPDAELTTIYSRIIQKNNISSSNFQKTLFIAKDLLQVDKDFFEPLMLLFDKSITPVENEMVDYNFVELVHESIAILDEKYNGVGSSGDEEKSVHFDVELHLLEGNYKSVSESLKDHIEYIAEMEIHIANMVGTGYGRALLPFPEDCIKSEILCHAFGAPIRNKFGFFSFSGIFTPPTLGI